MKVHQRYQKTIVVQGLDNNINPLNTIEKYHEEHTSLSTVQHIILYHINRENNADIKDCYQFIYHNYSVTTMMAIAGHLRKLRNNGLIIFSPMFENYSITNKGKRHLAEVFNWTELI